MTTAPEVTTATANVLSLPQIEAQTLAVLERNGDARVIAILAKTKALWPESVNLAGREFQLRWCESSLMARAAMVALDDARSEPANAGLGLILLTPLAARDLGGDVLARLARTQVFQPDAWAMVQQQFKAREIDARLNRFRWMAQLLVERSNKGVYPPVPNGFLDMETAWRHLLSRCLGLDAAKPDAAMLLNWSLGTDAAGLFSDLPSVAKPPVAAWLGEAAGAVGGLVMRCVMAGNTADALPLGLVCGVVLSPQAEGLHELAAAAIRLERFMGDRRIGVAEGRAWASEAAKALQPLSPSLRRAVQERAEALLKELHVDSFAHLSDVLPAGLELRLADLGAGLQAFIAAPSSLLLADVEAAAAAVLRHASAEPDSTRMLKVTMALRLCRWIFAGTLTEKPDAKNKASRSTPGFADLAHSYAAEGAFVDWARFKLIGGDDLPGLSAAFVGLRNAARNKAEAFNQRFASALQAWNREPRAKASCMPVEAVIDSLLAPLARQAPVLLLVADGLSYSIFRELCEDLTTLGWDEQLGGSTPTATPGMSGTQGAGTQGALALGIAALPTITEVSRTSLLSGRLVSGAAAQEKTAFAAHAALLSASRADAPPVVFHKGDISDAEGLSAKVRDAIASPQQQVVAVVYNAVDDHLSGSNQIQVRWTIDDLRLLGPLLSEARRARRVVVITADHGHVIDDGTVQRGPGDGDRWRLPSGAVDVSELVFEGGRVKTATGSTVVCAWSEGVRHGAKKNGYHGGVSAQEVVVPLSVFMPRGMSLKGWQPAPAADPDWWAASVVLAPALAAPPALLPRKPTKPKPVAMPQPDLFGTEVPAVAPAAPAVDWIEALQQAPAYLAQKGLAARVAPADADVRALLDALATRGGKLSKAALAQRLGLPVMRISGFINAAKRVLNVDQAAVLVLDETAGTVELNRDLLARQFRVTVR